MASTQIHRRERALLQEIHADPLNDEPFLAYAEWLIARGDLLGQFIRRSCRDRKAGKNSTALRRLVDRNGDEWIGDIPDNSAFEGGFFKGLPFVRLELHGRRVAPASHMMGDWAKQVSPRQLLSLCLDLKPSLLWGGTRNSCWLDYEWVFRHRLMEQVHHLNVAFGNSRSRVALSMARRRDVIRAIAQHVDPQRTPHVTFYEISKLTLKAAERELKSFKKVEFKELRFKD